MKHNYCYAGPLGYYGPSLDPEWNKLVKRANKLVDIYNANVCTFAGYKAQFKYQKEIQEQINQILKKEDGRIYTR